MVLFYLKKGRGSETRIIELALIVEKLVKELEPGIHKERLCREGQMESSQTTSQE